MSEFDDILTPDVRFHLVRRMERHKVIALAGPQLLPHEEKYLEFHNVAGVILFQRNVHSLSQVGELIQSVVETLGSDAPPPLVMADHEGDLVSELREIIGAPPSALAIAATGDADLAAEVARETGTAMRKLGLNAVLAPVADLYIDAGSAITGLRTFGREPLRAAAFVSASVDGFRAAGVAACVKHFPGHGATPEDSHETLPEVGRSLAELREDDLVPFRSALDAGVEMVMMSHVAYPMGRGELVPASFDRRIIDGLLREEMGFDGVVITDSLEMAGARWYATGSGGFSGGFERALLAGSDLLLHTRPIPEQVRIEGEDSPVMSINVMDTIIKTLEKVVDRGRIDEKLAAAAKDNEPLRNILAILDRSNRRVDRLRGSVEAAAPARPATSGKVIALGSYPTIPPVYRDVAERSLCAPHGWERVPGHFADRHVVVIPIQWEAGDSLKRHDLDTYVDVILKHFPGWERSGIVIDFDVDGDAVEPVVVASSRPTVIDATLYDGSAPSGGIEVAEGDALVLVVSGRGEPEEAFAAALERFAAVEQPDAVIVAGWPLTDWIPEGVPVLLSLGASPQAASAVAQALAGAIEPIGSLNGLLPRADA